MITRDRTSAEKVADTGARLRIEVTGDDGRDLIRVGVGRRAVVARSEISLGRPASELLADPLELVHEESDLDELDVPVLWIPEDVRVGNDEPHARLMMLEQGNGSDLIPGHHPIEHVLRLPEVGSTHGDLIELDELRLDQLEHRPFVEGRTTIHMSSSPSNRSFVITTGGSMFSRDMTFVFSRSS